MGSRGDRLQVGWVMGAAALALACVAGCGGAGEGPAAPPPPPPPVTDTQAPSISESSARPAVLEFTGGQVTFSATVTDAGGVSRVWAEVTPAGAATVTVNLVATGAGGLYTGTWTTPANTGSTGTPITCTARIYAQDASGNRASAGPFTITVQALEAPPAVPF